MQVVYTDGHKDGQTNTQGHKYMYMYPTVRGTKMFLESNVWDCCKKCHHNWFKDQPKFHTCLPVVFCSCQADWLHRLLGHDCYQSPSSSTNGKMVYGTDK